MNIILFDEPATKKNLLPFTFTRPVSEIRLGILTIKEKWERRFPGDYSYLTDNYLSKKFVLNHSSRNLFVNGSVLPDSALIRRLKALKERQLLIIDHEPIAFYGNLLSTEEYSEIDFTNQFEIIPLSNDTKKIRYGYDIFLLNRNENIADFKLLTEGRKSHQIGDAHTALYNPKEIFVEKNTTIRSAILNAETGPVYIGEEVDIGEGSVIRGGTSIGDRSILNVGTRIRGDTTIGPHCKVGGEISNSVIFGYSSKAHDGYLGNSVVGEWCNLGADTNTSNLKNNYKNVAIWNYGKEKFLDTGMQFCGLMMGDHAKCSINTMFNTGTVVGVSSNIFGSGFPPTFIPSFSWGGPQGFVTYQFQKAIEVIPKVFARRGKSLKEEDIEMLRHIFDVTKKYRSAYDR